MLKERFDVYGCLHAAYSANAAAATARMQDALSETFRAFNSQDVQLFMG